MSWKIFVPIVVLVFIGVLLIVSSWTAYNSTWQPGPVALGSSALTGAFLLYKIWSRKS